MSDDEQAPAAPQGTPARSFARELPVLLLLALGMALVIKVFLVQAFFIPSGSMETTLHGCPGCTGDRVLVNKVVYDLRSPHRGEDVVFDGAGVFDALGAPRTDYVKRVIAVERDVVACCDDGHLAIIPAGSTVAVVLDESGYVFEDGSPCGQGKEFGPVTVPAGRLWVMGDHRSESADSRCHTGSAGGGTVAVDHVIGKAFVIVYPLPRIGLLRTPTSFGVPALAAAAR